MGENIREMHTGKTYEHTRKKFGKKRADRQAVAVALNEERKGKMKRGKKRGKGRSKSARY